MKICFILVFSSSYPWRRKAGQGRRTRVYVWSIRLAESQVGWGNGGKKIERKLSDSNAKKYGLDQSNKVCVGVSIDIMSISTSSSIHR